ncbi:MAG: DUF4175 family protein [Gemmatimonadales bacterium]|nr:DUF4175 family protein [Gemmatimonadales bacterium]NIN11837.1 DUF4175 family protein [Gemmatimonadales bacterium]NIN50387.1 DUF4175 family protein [Gemmatimonadales bacterium]NIP07851.1 DUF4175 family protein [Gemmatimonadales bacterium]NIR02056.1 DUF4175 family protein [Gemmatimonadales bacterium]
MRSLFESQPHATLSDHEALLRVIRSVRNRWRLRVAVRGVAILVSTALVVFVVSAYGMDQFRFTPSAILVFRLLAYASLIGIAIRFLVMPLRSQVSDERVALYLEEHEPSLQGQVLSAVEFGPDNDGGDRTAPSPALIQRLVERAVESCAAIEYGRHVEQPRLARFSGMLVGVTLMSAAVFLLRPGFVANSAPFLLAPWSTGPASSPYSIEVEPGDAAVPRGADLKVTARLRNFDSELVEIALKRGDEEQWVRWPMTIDEEVGEYVFLAFNLEQATEYLVEASGVRSAVYRIEVRDLPYVDRIDLEYRFPAYTGLSPQRYEDGGDIAALAGTRVVLTVIPTMPVDGGAIVIDERDTIPLESADGILTGTLQVRRDGLYRVVLHSLDGTEVVGSPDYYIDALSDQPPAVSFAKPGRDITVTSIEEVFVEVEAEDDYGVGQLELVYSVNGGPEQIVELYTGGGARKQLLAGHTFYLEETELQPGDFISYFARATDGNRVGGPQTTTTDIYFMEVRPFDRRYRQAEAQGGGGGGAGDNVGELSRRQRQIVAATFKLVRDSTEYTGSEMRENLATLALAQGRLREEVETLVRRIEGRRVVELDSTFRAVAEALPQAVKEMEVAEESLGVRKLQEALSPEQRALQHLQRAEAAFRDRMVSQGGGGGQAASAEELADLFDLELDKLRNQYESVDRGERRQVDQQIDEVLEKLRELARRQQQENERMRAGAQNLNSAGGGGGQAQRRLADQAEEVARRLERLAREQSRPDLQETARRLGDAVEAMRRAAANQRSGGAAQGSAALDRLREARRLLEENRSASLEREVRDALRRAERLAEQERDVIRDVERLGQDETGRAERVKRLVERKDEMASEADDLESQLLDLARNSRDEQPDASRKLQEAAKGMRDARLADKIRFSRGVVQGRSPEYARNFEEQIGSDLDELAQQLRDALGAIGESREQRLSRSLDRARELVNALESLDERMRARGEEGQRGQESQQGQQGQGRQQGRQGQGRQEAQEGVAPSELGGAPPRGGGPGQLSPGDVRQFRRELAERRSELTELRRELQREGVDVQRLDEILRGVRALENRLPIGDPRGLAELAGDIIPGLKEFEYALRRQIEGADVERLFLSGSEEVPAEYRRLVEEYYKSLSRNRRQQ